MQAIRDVPRDMRTAWYAGLGGTLVSVNMIAVGIAFALAGDLPPLASAALLLLTPIYFLTSLWSSARERAGYVSMVLGLALGPLFHLWTPGFDLLAAGLVGGFAAFGYHLASRRRRAT
jgi:hypothetical protein